MNKKLISVAVAAAFAAPMAASADATIYGAIDTGILIHELEGPGGTIIDNVEVKSYDGALGIKGSEDLGNGLSAIYKFEINYDGDDGAISGTADEVWVGLAGDFGAVALGREDHPYKNVLNASGYNPFGDRLGDLDGINDEVGGIGFRQATTSNGIVYISPNFSGFSGQAALVAPEGTEADTTKDGLDAFSLGVNYAGGGLKVGLAYEDIDATEGDDVSAWALAGSYTFGDFMVGIGYEEQEDAAVASGIEDVETLGLSATYSFGNSTVGASYVMEEQDFVGGGSTDIDGWALNYNYDMSNRTAVYASYVDSENEDDFNSDNGADEYSGFTVGLVHSF